MKFRCLLPTGCLPIGLGIKVLEVPLKWAPIESNGDAIGKICEVQMCSIGIF